MRMSEGISPDVVARRKQVASARADNYAIVVEALEKSYANTRILQNVNFELNKGEFLTLLGPSGSGKSTTLGVIAGFVDPTHGDVRIGNRSIINLPPRHRNLGIVFQNYALFPHMTVANNIEFGLRMRNVPRAERRKRVGDILERVGLDGLAYRKPSQLSGGQQQRVALARALIIDPAALLLDEPLGALDRRLRKQVEIELKSLQRRTGVSVLYVTHDQEEAMVMSDRLAVMRDGQIEQIDTPNNVYKYPLTRFTAEFLGEANLFDVTVEDLRGETASIRYADGSRGQVHSSTKFIKLQRDAKATMCVRPERIRFIDRKDSAENIIAGIVSDSVYLGSSIRCTVNALQTDIIMTVPDTHNLTLPEPGTRVRLGWGVEDGQLLLNKVEQGYPQMVEADGNAGKVRLKCVGPDGTAATPSYIRSLD